MLGGGGFLLACGDYGGMLGYSFSVGAFSFFKVEISSRTLIPLFRPRSVHSGSVSLDDCGQVFPDKLRVSLLLPDRFPHYTWTVA